LSVSQARHWHIFANKCRLHTHYAQHTVAEKKATGEMAFLDPETGEQTKRFTTLATFTEQAAGTWQKTQSGPVCTMQLRVGFKGRHVPAGQREPELVLA
jgi:hypothetical protein